MYLPSEQPEEEIMDAGNPLDEGLRQEILSVWMVCRQIKQPFVEQMRALE